MREEQVEENECLLWDNEATVGSSEGLLSCGSCWVCESQGVNDPRIHLIHHPASDPQICQEKAPQACLL